ncbi:MAG TPA: riboflavin synthase [Rhizomicrobium sp.]|jgi:riboflavin synthase|nr:riboflavin synthase [Rhizomicrobium sp.]
MFTGIVTDLGEVRRIEKRGDTHIVIGTNYETGEIELGASIACSGICLTVVDRGRGGDGWFAVTASAETVSKTNLGEWAVGSVVNLERPVRVGDELGGHIVTGHIDGTAKLIRLAPEGESTRMLFEVPAKLASLIAPKGSIAVDGVSLTVNEANGDRFGVNVIPHTLKVTSFGQLKEGSHVNVEVDLLARYVQRLLKA